jgi:hypothetical protein
MNRSICNPTPFLSFLSFMDQWIPQQAVHFVANKSAGFILAGSGQCHCCEFDSVSKSVAVAC